MLQQIGARGQLCSLLLKNLLQSNANRHKQFIFVCLKLSKVTIVCENLISQKCDVLEAAQNVCSLVYSVNMTYEIAKWQINDHHFWFNCFWRSPRVKLYTQSTYVVFLLKHSHYVVQVFDSFTSSLSIELCYCNKQLSTQIYS